MSRNYLLHAVRSLFAVAILVGSSAVGATSVDLEADAIQWVGDGPNAAFVVIDFDDDVAFIFGGMSEKPHGPG